MNRFYELVRYTLDNQPKIMVMNEWPLRCLMVLGLLSADSQEDVDRYPPGYVPSWFTLDMAREARRLITDQEYRQLIRMAADACETCAIASGERNPQ